MCRSLTAICLSTFLVLFTTFKAPADEPLNRLDPRRVPAWAQPGAFRYARWDGGNLDVVKGFLSGWPHSREPDQIMAVGNWYEPRNVELVKMAHLNWIWVTFSNGFSLASERPSQQRLAEFIAACHREGIHTTAYMSIANMFPDDMFRREPQSRDWIALGKDGKPVPYGAADYSKFTTVTRYLACLLHPQWREYQKKRVDRFIDAGGDGVMWDNAGLSRCYCPRCTADYAGWRERCGAPDQATVWNAYQRHTLANLVAELHEHAIRRKPDFLMYVNCNRGLFCLNRSCNAVSSEDGTEPGVDGQGKVVNNIGLLRYQWAVGGGWRPVRVEYGGRLHKGPFESRYTVPMTPHSHQLAIAEAAAHHVGFEIYSLGEFQRDLYFRQPEAIANLQAAGRYNAFLAEHESLYVRPRSLASVAVLANDDDRQLDVCRALADRGVLFDVVFAATLKADSLAAYHVIVADDVKYLSDQQLQLLSDWAIRGGRLIVTGDTGEYTDHFQPREHDPLGTGSFFGHDQPSVGARPKNVPVPFPPADGKEVPLGQGSVRHLVHGKDWQTIAKPLLDQQRAKLIDVAAPATVRFNVHGQRGSNLRLLHLLNYGPEPVTSLKATLPGRIAKVTLLSPDGEAAEDLPVVAAGSGSAFVVPKLKIYAVATIQLSK